MVVGEFDVNDSVYLRQLTLHGQILDIPTTGFI